MSAIPTTALEIAAAVRGGRLSARAVTDHALAQIKARNPTYNAFTRILGERARAQADAVDRALAAGGDPGPLAGVPFAVKDLFDVEGLITTAGSATRLSAPAAPRDAEAVARLKAAGAILVGTLNMDEFAYGFITDNAHFGATHNPHDLRRYAGGSSGGSAAAVAAGLVPISLGSDTNGSIRVPAALCGIYGLRATHGRLSAQGVFPFAASLDQAGPYAASLEDLRLAYAILDGQAAPEDQPSTTGLRLGRLGGWFARSLDPALTDGIAAIAAAFGHGVQIELPNVAEARSAAFIITAAEGGNLHLPQLRKDPARFDPATRDRLMAGALMPAASLVQAHRFRGWFRDQVHAAFEIADILIAPTCDAVAPRMDDPTVLVDGERVPARAYLGIHTQPLSLAGFPVLAAPLTRPAGALPLGVQLVARPNQEALLFAVAAELERQGLIGVTAPPMA